ncbi:MAG: quinolinate synthase NadA [Candidatus Vogelbacteria bacterium]|nr:quinolinate synthase NadA [Candidatus Vogelbacteria bacterium]
MTEFTGDYFYKTFTERSSDLYPDRYTKEYCDALAEMANRAAKLITEKNILLLVHNYQYPEIQELGFAVGYVGDSYGLSLKARDEKGYSTIAFSSVEFMAETAKIINPEKKVLVPTRASCSLVESVILIKILKWKEKNPTGKVVSYINTDAKTKALSDFICTSRNASKVVAHVRTNFPGDPILFLPDKYLANVVISELGLKFGDLDIWDGSCYIHKELNEETIDKALFDHPNAELLRHPECGCTQECIITALRQGIKIEFVSTERMITKARESASQEFVVATEPGMVDRLRRELPNKRFYPVSKKMCKHMKQCTLEGLLECLEHDDDPKYQIILSKEILDGAKVAIDNMMSII